MTNTSAPSIRPARSKSKLFLIIGIFALLLVSAGAAYYFWTNRPISPVVLNAKEQAVLDQKVEAVEERKYEKGEKVLVLTEREVNALLHHNTGLGDKVRLELANNAIHARIRIENIDEDLPLIGGRTLKAKARFELTDSNGRPAIILDDLTVYGISLPNAWLADLKGKNLLSNLGLNQSRNRFAEGIESIKVENGKITIKLAE